MSAAASPRIEAKKPRPPLAERLAASSGYSQIPAAWLPDLCRLTGNNSTLLKFLLVVNACRYMRRRRSNESVPAATEDLNLHELAQVLNVSWRMVMDILRYGLERKLFKVQRRGQDEASFELLVAGWPALPDYEPLDPERSPSPCAGEEVPDEAEAASKKGTVQLVSAPLVVKSASESRVVKIDQGVKGFRIRSLDSEHVVVLKHALIMDGVIDLSIFAQAISKNGRSNGINKLIPESGSTLHGEDHPPPLAGNLPQGKVRSLSPGRKVSERDKRVLELAERGY